MAVVFVYGTLKKGFNLHHYLEDAKFLGDGFIEGYEMYKISWYPAVVKGEGKVFGEVYDVDEETLKILDVVEDEGVLYKRIKEKIKTEDGDLEGFVYIYISDLNGCEKIEEGVFK